MRYFSMFSGIGGFELGIQQNFTKSKDCPYGEGGASLLPRRPFCVGFSEIDKYAIQVYTKHFPTHKGYGDASKINTTELPDFDFLCGGFPCQAFSIAGKRGGFNDTRGTLFFEIARILKEKKPRMFLLENVKGLLSHDNGRTFKTIIATLVELGYGVEWQVLNSKNFGVPQNRERVFIVGHLGDASGREIFPINQAYGENTKLQGHIANCLTARYEGAQATGTYIGESKFNAQIKETQKLSDSQRIRMIDQPSVTLKGLGGGQGAKTGLYAIPVLTPDRPEKRQNGRRMKEDRDPSFTLTAQDKHGVFDGYRIRRLTPTECCRLQGFPDNWVDVLSDSQKYKCLGNAVTTNVIAALFEKILKRYYNPPAGEI